jgi:hypothetical protein
MLVSISNQAKLVAFINYRRLEIKWKGSLGELGSKQKKYQWLKVWSW